MINNYLSTDTDGDSRLMFGELSISENPLATQGVVRLGFRSYQATLQKHLL